MAYLFNGTTSKLVLSSGLITAVPFTMACFFKTAAVGVIQVLVSADNGVTDTNRFVYYLQTAGTIECATTNSTNAVATTTETASANLWSSAAFVSSTVTSRYAVYNGRASIINTTSKTPTGINEFMIGAHGAGTLGFNGLIAEAAVWQAALTPRELQSFNDGVPASKIRSESLILYMPLTQQLGVTDLSPRSLVFANTAAVPVSDHPFMPRPTIGLKPWQ